MKIICAQCGAQVEMPDPPRPRILNTADISVLVADHPKPGFCLGCKLPVAIVMIAAQLQLAAMPIEPAQAPSPIIVMPGSALKQVK
jgi:hypothetical protein